MRRRRRRRRRIRKHFLNLPADHKRDLHEIHKTTTTKRQSDAAKIVR
jgi:hypothetical protein